MKLTTSLAISLLLAFLVFISQIIVGVVYALKEQTCSEICFPYNYDMLDTNTCSCWLPNGKLMVVEIK